MDLLSQSCFCFKGVKKKSGDNLVTAHIVFFKSRGLSGAVYHHGDAARALDIN